MHAAKPDLNFGHAFLAPGVANKSEFGRHHLLVRQRRERLAQVVDALHQQILWGKNQVSRNVGPAITGSQGEAGGQPGV